MSLPWLLRQFLHPDDVKKLEKQIARSQRQDTRERIEEYLQACYRQHVPNIERCYARHHFDHDLRQLLSTDGLTKQLITNLTDKIARRAEFATVEAFYEQHFVPGSQVYDLFDFDDAVTHVSDSLPLTEYFDALQRVRRQMQRLLRESRSSVTPTVLTTKPRAAGDFRQNMRAVYRQIEEKVQKQAYPGATQSVLAAEVENQWNAWQQQNGVFATILQSQPSSSNSQ